ncbi:guanine deaminase [Colletotrichum tofieldiae]|nr:guanine deaminase [Colletotrichum tofieldiae]
MIPFPPFGPPVSALPGAGLKDQKKARRVYTACVRRTLAHGTTTSAYYATIDVDATNLLADICLALGQRAFVGRVCMDREGLCPEYYRDESPEDSLRKTRETVDHVRSIDPRSEIVAPILTPRFAPACSSAAMKGLADMQKELDVLVQTHVSENEGEIELVKELYPRARATPTCTTPTAFWAKRRSSRTRSTSRRRRRPRSPRGGQDLALPLQQQQHHERRGAGGVGVAARGHGLAGEERERAKLTVEEVLYLGTKGGAKVEKIGGFEVGMQWDAQLIGLPLVDEDGEQGEGGGNVDVFGWESWEDRVAKWLFNGDDRNTKTVWVKGRMVHSRR